MKITYHKIHITQKKLLRNLLKYYVYECGTYLENFQLKEDGGIEHFKELDRFLGAPYDTYIIRVNRHIAGLVIVKTIEKNQKPLYIIEQFFILKHYHGHHVGKIVAKQIFDQYQGRWIVQQKEKNYPAQAFWRNVIKEYTHNHYVERYDENRDVIQEFQSVKEPLILHVDENLTLKSLETEDCEALFQLVDTSRHSLRQWLPWIDSSQSADDTKKFIQEQIHYYIQNKSVTMGIWYHDELVGTIGFHMIDWNNKSTTIGYMLHERAQGLGIMTRSCHRLIQYAFDKCDLHRIEIQASPNNRKSCAIPERLGFSFEGCRRESEWLYDHFVDLSIYSILKREWQISTQNKTPKEENEQKTV